MEQEQVNSRPSNRDPLQNLNSKYSIGTAFAVDTVEKLYAQGTLKDCDFLINISTLLRNHLDGSKTQLMDDVVSKMRMELGYLLDELVSIVKTGSTNPKPKIIFYLCDYETGIPKHLQRPFTDNRNLLANTIKLACKQFDKLFPTKSGNFGKTYIEFTVGPPRMQSSVFLISKMKSLGGFTDTVMISHCPVDFHVHRYCKKFSIIETHTGRYRTSKELGDKVFKHPNLPFIPALHMLLGDKEYVVPSIGIKEKRLLLEMAEKRKWELSTSFSIEENIRSLGIGIPKGLD